MRDIAYYFDPSDLGIALDTWDGAWNAFRTSTDSPSAVYTGSGFKKWARRNGTEYHTDGLRRVAAQKAPGWREHGSLSASRAKDLNDLAQLIVDISRGPRAL